MLVVEKLSTRGGESDESEYSKGRNELTWRVVFPAAAADPLDVEVDARCR